MQPLARPSVRRLAGATLTAGLTAALAASAALAPAAGSPPGHTGHPAADPLARSTGRS